MRVYQFHHDRIKQFRTQPKFHECLYSNFRKSSTVISTFSGIKKFITARGVPVPPDLLGVQRAESALLLVSPPQEQLV